MVAVDLRDCEWKVPQTTLGSVFFLKFHPNHGDLFNSAVLIFPVLDLDDVVLCFMGGYFYISLVLDLQSNLTITLVRRGTERVLEEYYGAFV